jgi:hypothetical protein
MVAPAATQVRCANTTSGTAWTIALDRPHSLAAGHAASFAERKLSWSDLATGTVYDLDRATGVFTVTRGSSTGGYVSVYACRS